MNDDAWHIHDLNLRIKGEINRWTPLPSPSFYHLTPTFEDVMDEVVSHQGGLVRFKRLLSHAQPYLSNVDHIVDESTLPRVFDKPTLNSMLLRPDRAKYAEYVSIGVTKAFHTAYAQTYRQHSGLTGSTTVSSKGLTMIKTRIVHFMIAIRPQAARARLVPPIPHHVRTKRHRRPLPGGNRPQGRRHPKCQRAQVRTKRHRRPLPGRNRPPVRRHPKSKRAQVRKRSLRHPLRKNFRQILLLLPLSRALPRKRRHPFAAGK